jgi:hypothetical protein
MHNAAIYFKPSQEFVLAFVGNVAHHKKLKTPYTLMLFENRHIDMQ